MGSDSPSGGDAAKRQKGGASAEHSEAERGGLRKSEELKARKFYQTHPSQALRASSPLLGASLLRRGEPLASNTFVRRMKVENKFQPSIENAVFLAAYTATEKHGTYDHSFSRSFCALKCSERNGHIYEDQGLSPFL